MLRRTRNRILTAGFVVALLLPMMDMLFGLDASRSLGENRNLASKPEIPLLWRKPGLFHWQLKEFLQDQFGFRNLLVHWHSIATAKWLGVSPTPHVVMGKDGWLFLGGETLEEYCGLRPFTPEELKEWTTTLKSRSDWLGRRGIKYFFVVAPNPHTIYPEYLPDGITRVAGPSRLDQLLTELRRSSSVATVDLRPALIAAKSSGRLYHRTDTHWNARGAFIGCQQIVTSLQQTFPNLPSLVESDYERTSILGPSGDLAGQIGMGDEVREEILDLRLRSPGVTSPPIGSPQLIWVKYTSIKTVQGPSSSSHLPRVVVLRDSYGEAIIPFLAKPFSRAVYVWVDDGFDATVIESEKPEIVIQELTERYLLRRVKADVPQGP